MFIDHEQIQCSAAAFTLQIGVLTLKLDVGLPSQGWQSAEVLETKRT